MTETELLQKVKNGLGITGNFQDETLLVYLNETKAFMESAGVDKSVIDSEVSVGCIMRGIADLWNYGSGNAKLSDYFKMRVLQLKAVKKEEAKPVKRISPRFYSAEYINLDYSGAADYFEKYKPILGGCSVIANGNIIGRNYDWYFDERCSFFVRTTADFNRHATIGMAQAPSELTSSFIESGEQSDLYKIIPFMLLDGVNDAGLFCEINVTTGEKGTTIGTNPEKEDLFALMIPRYVLDYADTVDEGIRLLEDRNIFCANVSGTKQEYHFLLKDSTKTAVIEFIGNEMNVIEDFVNDKPIMTNFYLTDYDGTRESLTPYAQGIERQDILSAGYDAATTENKMMNLMREVFYSGAYKTHIGKSFMYWYSEFCGNWDKFGNLTKDSPIEDYQPILQYVFDLFKNRKRDGQTWYTVHTSVYNLEEKKLIVVPQEAEFQFVFRLESEV